MPPPGLPEFRWRPIYSVLDRSARPNRSRVTRDGRRRTKGARRHIRWTKSCLTCLLRRSLRKAESELSGVGRLNRWSCGVSAKPPRTRFGGVPDQSLSSHLSCATGLVFPEIFHICLQTSFTVVNRADEPDHRDQRRCSRPKSRPGAPAAPCRVRPRGCTLRAS